MPNSLSVSFFKISLWAGAIWLLARHLGVQVDSPLALSGKMLGFWTLYKILFICTRTLYRRHSSPLKNLPGPTSVHWLYDHVFDVFDEPLAWEFTNWMNDREYPQGLMHFFGIFGSSYIVPTSPETLVEALSTRAYDYSKPSAFKKYTTRFWGHGIVSQEQEEHRTHRKTYLPVFNQSNVNRLKHTIFNKSMQFVDRVSDICDSSTGNKSVEIPIYQLTALVSLDVVGIFSLGHDLNTIRGENHKIFEAHETLFTSTQDKRRLFLLYNIAPQWILDLLPFPVGKKLDAAHDLLASVCRRIIRERGDNLSKDETQAVDFVTNLVKKNLYDEDAAISQILVILGAGYESTGGTLAWIFACLARHPNAQEKLRKELIEEFRGQESLDAEADYEGLVMLNAVVTEATRLYPAFTFLPRKAIRDTSIGGQLIPKGTFIGLAPRANNYSHALWGPEAAQFIPERWIDESDPLHPKPNPLGGASASVCMMSYFYGTRSCVGRELAVAQMKQQVALVVRRFHIEPVGDANPRPMGLFATSPPHDLRLGFTKLAA